MNRAAEASPLYLHTGQLSAWPTIFFEVFVCIKKATKASYSGSVVFSKSGKFDMPRSVSYKVRLP